MKVLWAFDPFQKNNELNTFGRKIINTLFDKKDSVAAVYVASNSEVEISTAFDVPENLRYSTYPKKLILNELKKLKMEKMDINVLESRKISLSSIIEVLVKHTEKQKTDLIVIATNGRKLLPRMIFGSFCETLIHSSTCDILAYHQKTAFKSMKNILYAHEFSKKGDAGLLRVMEFAKKWNAAITVVHIPMYEADVTYDKFKANTQKRAAEVEKLILKNNIACKMIINYEIKPIHKIILNVASKNQSDVIAMSADSSKLTALLGGSVSRQVLREAKIPSLIIKV